MMSADEFIARMFEAQASQLSLLRTISQQLTVKPPIDTALQWQKANPFLARSCREAAETLNKVYNQWLADLTEEIVNKSEELVGNEFTRNELIDKHAVRLSQFATMLTNLQLLGGTAPQAQSR
jgi:hypothetical protein